MQLRQRHLLTKRKQLLWCLEVQNDNSKMAASMRSLLLLHQKIASRAVYQALFSSHCKLCTSTAATTQPAEKWQLLTAVCLERFPIVGKDKSDMDKKYQEMLDRQEFEGSLLSDHELRHKEDLVVAQKRKAEDYEETESDINRVTALDLEDLWEAEYKTFMANNQLTGNTNEGDLKSTDRELDEKLTLVVQQKLGDLKHWILPQGAQEADQSMRECAEQTLQSLCGDGVQAQFIGNAPCGFLKYKYPPSSSYTGAKVFFYKAHYLGGNVQTPDSQITDYVWVKKKDFHKYMPEKYLQVVDDFVLDL